MPELPEVETVVRGLRPHMVGRRIVDVRIADGRLVRPMDPGHVADVVQGRLVEKVWRRGKYIIIDLEDDVRALIHLRMTGSFSRGQMGDEPARGHVRATYVLSDGTHLHYHDPRRFGTLMVANADAVIAYLDERLGPEPLEASFTASSLRVALRARSGPIKSALLDQRVVAGLGNIYVDESLHRAKISPMASSQRVSRVRLERLVPIIVSRLEEAIEAGGSTLRDYRGVEGADGTMQERFVVYGRSGLPCFTCGRVLRSATIAGRTTVWCSRCQAR